MAENVRSKASDQLAAALAAGQSIRAAATSVGVSERTVYRRLEDASFKRRVELIRAETMNQVAGQLADTASEAVTALGGLLKAESESVRCTAARNILDICVKYRETNELAARIAELEAIQEAHHGNQPPTPYRIA